MPGPVTRSRWPRTSARRSGFDKSITDFAERYADQNEQDYLAFADAIRSGRLEASRTSDADASSVIL